MRHAGDNKFGDDFNYCERASHDDELNEQAARGIDELRKKGREKENALGIRQCGERPLLK